MKKLLSTAILITLLFTFCKAQFVPIADNQLVQWFYGSDFASCMKDTTLDTACAQAQNITFIEIGGAMSSFNGLQYLTSVTDMVIDQGLTKYITSNNLPPNLKSLNINSSPEISGVLTSLPPRLERLTCGEFSLGGISFFPSTLKYLNLYSLQSISTLPDLPNGMDTLIITNSYLSSLPALPSSLRYIQCTNSGLSTFPALPSSLTYFNCSNNSSLTSIPSLPANLTNFICDFDQVLSSLPSLNKKLRYVDCTDCNQLTTLPTLPDSLVYLNCSNYYSRHLTSLPSLPNRLEYLDCSNNLITSLPVMAASARLRYLNCEQNKISSIPNFSNNLDTLLCSVNLFTSLPALPASLKLLDCSFFTFSSFPALPDGLTDLTCINDNLTSLPSLPSHLKRLTCFTNKLTSLPTLPAGLTYLFCGDNPLHTLPALPSTLTELHCAANQLTSLPALPSGLGYLDCDNNSGLGCFLNLPSTMSVLNFSSTNIHCLPSKPNITSFSSPDISTLPLCSASVTVTATPGNTICAGTTASLSAISGYTSYHWSTGETTQNISGLGIGGYSLTVSNGCPVTVSANISQTPCGAPTGITLNAIQNTSVRISWTVQPCAFNAQIHYRVTGTTIWLIIGVNAPTNARTITGLVAGTKYDLQLRTRCSSTANIYSSWTTIQNFTTKGATCDAPATLTANNLKQTRATISWTTVSGAYSYKLHTRLKGTTPWTSRTILAPTINKVLTGLTANTAYEYQLQTICDISGTPASAWTSVETFNTTLRMEEESGAGDAGDFVLYPNPASSIVAVSSSSGQVLLGKMEITDLLGRSYLTQTLATETTVTTLDVSNLTAGVYFVTLHSVNGNAVRKFVKE